MELSVAKLKLISKGADSYIYIYGQQEQVVAMKMVKSNSKQSKHLFNEYTILKQLHHENIIMPFKLKRNVNTENLHSETKKSNSQTTQTLNSNQFDQISDILVLQYAQKGSLMKVIRENRYSVPQIRYLFQQICEAVDYLHCNYIVHRDLKLQNIFVSVEDCKLFCKLGDFGFASSCYVSSELILFNSYKGTKRGYMAPEIHATLLGSQSYYDARKSDIFALGVILFALVLGRLPFEYATMQNNLYKLIVQEKYEQFWKQHGSSLKYLQHKNFGMVEDFKSLFISMAKFDVNSRVNMQDVLDSDWLNGMKEEIHV